MKKYVLRCLIGLAGLSLLTAVAVTAQDTPETVSLPVLMYHHILTDSAACGDYVILPETFEQDLQYLQDHGYESVRTEQLIAYAEGRGTLPEKPVLITFDDGQASFAAYALPLLEQYDMSAVLAIVGKFSDDYTENGDTNVKYAYLSWPALQALSQNPHVELAVHTYDMHHLKGRRGCGSLPGESSEDYQRALCKDLGQIERRFSEQLGFVPTTFAYPFGIYSKDAKSVLSQRGYQILLTCDEMVNHLSTSENLPITLGRFNRPFSANRETLFRKMGIQ